jgi:hypothetical protein
MPIEVSQSLAQSSSAVVNQAIRSLSNWRSGQPFYDFLIDYAGSSGCFGSDDLTRLSLRAEDAARHGYRPNVDWIAKERKRDDTKATKIARHIVKALEAIRNKIPTDRPLILLGRGTQPLVAGLHADGRPDVQYFILTRKQLQDLATQRQWRKEVPPNGTLKKSHWPKG